MALLPTPEALLSFFESDAGTRRDLTRALEGDDGLSRAINAFGRDFEALAADTLANAAKVSVVASAIDGDVQALDLSISNQGERVLAAVGLVRRDRASINALAEAADSARSASASVYARTTENESFLAGIAESLGALGTLVLDAESFMERLVAQMGVIDSQVASLSDVSERLGVLAINTAIEAARAGEGGKGFAIIAKEMQKLSKLAFGETKVVAKSVSSVRREVDGMSGSLGKSRTSVQGSLESSRSVVSRFHAIREGVQLLDGALESQAGALKAQREAAEEMTASFEAIEAENARVSDLARSTERLSTELGEVVASVIERIGTYRTGLHRKALTSLEDIARRIPPADALLRDPDPALRPQFERYPWFELLYLMDADGTQVSSNMVNPAYAATVSSEGKGRSWREKPYFAAPRKTSSPYVSDIYLSVASRRLCLTVSLPLLSEDGSFAAVLAADLNVGDMGRIA
jgi:methyl-accepting chemotaxis protein